LTRYSFLYLHQVLLPVPAPGTPACTGTRYSCLYLHLILLPVHIYCTYIYTLYCILA
jgi:hypothetical protein